MMRARMAGGSSSSHRLTSCLKPMYNATSLDVRSMSVLIPSLNHPPLTPSHRQMQMHQPHPSSPIMTSLLPLSLSSSFFRSPFTRQSLQSIAQHLAMPISSRQIPSDWNPRPPTRKGLSGEAAVLIPLLNLADRVDTSRSFRSGTLLQVRPGGMRMHAGEVR